LTSAARNAIRAADLDVVALDVVPSCAP